jgi:hypothetical protein
MSIGVAIIIALVLLATTMAITTAAFSDNR